MKKIAALILFLLAVIIVPVSAGEEWTKTLGEEITAVATDEYGDRIFVGTESGKLYCYDSAGSVVWSQTLSGEVVALEVDGAADYLLVEIGDGTRIESRDPETGAYRWSQSASPTRHITLSQAEGILANTISGYTLRLRDGDANIWSHISIGTTTDLAISGDASWVVSSSGSDLKLYALSVPEADEWLTSGASWAAWNHRIAHTIAGSPDSALTNYPVEITVIRGAGSSAGSTLYAPDCHVDFADIRFTAADGVTQLPYYLESVVGSTATFLVNVPSIPASPGTTTIYIYWANPVVSTTTSDPDAARYTLDDFSGTSLNTDIWETFGTATITVADGKLTITGDNIGYSGVRSKGMYTGANDKIEVNANVEGQLGDNGAFWIGFFGDGQVPNSIKAELAVTLNRATFTSWNTLQQLHGSTADGSARANYLFGSRLTGYNDYRVEWDGTSADMQAGAYAKQTLANAPTTNSAIMLAIGDVSAAFGGVTMTVDSVTIVSPANIPALHGAWSAVESIVTLLDTETLTGTIVGIDAPETGDWVAVSTTTKTYIIQITDTGFGKIYNDDRVGTPYQIQVADGGSFAIEGRNILADIFRIDAVQVGTYTTGGAVQHVALAQKNGLYAAAGSDDGKYYIFSKDETSAWYLLYASDSYDPVTAIAMTWRGEYTVIGRSDGRLTLYSTETESDGFWYTIYFQANGNRLVGYTVTVTDGGTDQSQWDAFTRGLTDSDGKYVLELTSGNYYRFNVTVDGTEYSKIIHASETNPTGWFRIHVEPVSANTYLNAYYDSDANTINLTYQDNAETPSEIRMTILRTDNYSTVYSTSFTSTQIAEAAWPVTDQDVMYKSIIEADRSAGTIKQSYPIKAGGNIAPQLPLTANEGNVIWMGFLMVLAGMFGRLHSAKGALMVALAVLFLTAINWITIPWEWATGLVLFAFLGMAGTRRG